MTYEELVEKVAHDIHPSAYWGDPCGNHEQDAARAMARSIISTIAQALKEPTEEMETAPGIDPDDCATPDAARCVWHAMLAASPLYPEQK